MPIYEYLCQSCGHELEAIQKVAEPPLLDCPACNKRKLKKKLSVGAFRLSGSGWYETDFKTGSKKNIAGDQAAGAGKKEEAASAASKPAAATDTAATGKSSTAA